MLTETFNHNVLLLLTFSFLLINTDAFQVVGEYYWSKTGLHQNISKFDEIKDKHLVGELRLVYPENLYALSSKDISGFEKLQRFAIQGGIGAVHPGSFVDVPELKEIRIYLNHILKFRNRTFSNLNVERLLLHSNQLIDLDEDAVVNLPHLSEIDLSTNHLVVWDGTAFRNTPNVRKLSLRANHLKRLDDKAFASFPKLEKLDVSSNEIKHVGLFMHDLPRIKSIDFNQNQLTRLPDTLMGPAFTFPSNETRNFYGKSYDVIDLSDNQLSYMPTSILDVITGTDVLSIAWNPWHCGCYNMMREWSISNHVQLKDLKGLSAEPCNSTP